ncbi:hypothetical protein AA21952_1794 [Acetobacter oeni LMG 21952]|nr:hypothetical protein AA21952_1794 [Acetobacter oeni LMG 21952]
MAKAGCAAGQSVTLYRPTTATDPLQQAPVASLSVLFDIAATMPAVSPAVWGHPVAYAMGDITQMRVGDYLVTQASSVIPGVVADTYFIARIDLSRPALVVRTNAVIDVLESDPTSDNETVGYRQPEGPVASKDVTVATGWPVSLIAHGGSSPPTHLGTDVPRGSYSLMMPAIPGVLIYSGLRFRDATGTDYHTSSVELSEFGVRLSLLEDRV